MQHYYYYLFIAAFWAFWTALLFGGCYLLHRLHRRFYVRRSALKILGECYTPEQIRSAFNTIFAAKLGAKTTQVYNAFLLRLTESDGE